jgi:hypothetical protein
MRNQKHEATFDRVFPQANDKITTNRELSSAELDNVSGGINPQPLPPRVDD